MDANGDGTLAAGEEVPLKTESAFHQGGYEHQWTNADNPVPCRVAYTRADGGRVAREVAVYFSFLRNKPMNAGRGRRLAPVIYFYQVQTFFTGTGRFLTGGGEVESSFALLDGDNNGVYNDFGRDLLVVDANRDGTFDLVRETRVLTEFDEIKPERNRVEQRRKVLFPWPSVLLIQPSRAPIDWRECELEDQAS